MIRPGLVSITFRTLTPREVIDIAVRAGLSGIEWGGDVHVPHGDTAAAREVLNATREAGLEVAAYGSYYRVGHSEDEGLSFHHVLHTAIVLEAPVIRVWAGKQNSQDASEDYFQLIVNEMQHICEKAQKAGIRVAAEFHNNTLTNTSESTLRLLQAVNHPNFRTLWQPPLLVEPDQALKGLQLLLPYLEHLHVFQWEMYDRLPLKEGEAAWKSYLQAAESTERDVWALLEFVPDESSENLMRDAATLKSWLRDGER